jgi:integrase
MSTVNLTDKKLRSLKPGSTRVEYWDKSLGAFGVRVTPTGEKSFCIMYRIGGKQRRHTLGVYPKLSLADAREMAKDAFELVRKGKDPVQEKKAEEAKAVRERIESKTFSRLAQEYLEDYAKKNKRSWDEDERIIDKILNPEFGTMNVKEISRSQVKAFLRKIAVRAPVAANRTHACLRKIFSWGIKEEVVDLEANPCSGISRPGGREKPKERVLSDAEIKSILDAVEKEDPAIRHILRLILLTGQRPGEVMGALWDEVDLNQALWTIPGSRTKNGLLNVVPLSPQAARAFEKQQESLLEQRRKREERGDMIPVSPYVFPNRLISRQADAPIVHIRKAVGRLHRSLNLTPFSAHDLRRTCATRLGQMGVPGHVIGRILNHKPTDITSSVYNQYEYLKEKREALDDWGARVAKIVSGLELVVKPLVEA